jgi:hypothetical protein
MEQAVTLRELAVELKMHPTNLRKYALARGFDFLRVRTEASRHQLTLALSPSEADRLRQLRKAEGFVF